MENFEEDLKEKIERVDYLLAQRRYSEAVFELKEVICLFPEQAYLYYLLGMARMKCGRFLLAKRALQKANRLLPNNSENLRSLGWVKVMLGEFEEARKDLREVINLDLTNHLAYLDLAMSYFNCLDFKQGFEWLERAKALSPRDQFVLENYKIAKEMEKEFSRYSKAKVAGLKKKRLDAGFQKQVRLSILEEFFRKGVLTKDEADEITEELKLNGLLAGAVLLKDGSSDEEEIKVAREYIEWHNKVDNIEKKLTKNKEKEVGERLFSNNVSLSEIKDCILRLAHQGTKQSLKFLGDFRRKHSGELKTWAEMAMKECQSFLEMEQ